MNLSVNEIVEAIGGTVYGASETALKLQVSCVVIDSRKVEQRGVFLATVGERVDGHSFIQSVFEKGAALVIGSKTPEEIKAEYGFLPQKQGMYVCVSDPFVALKQIAKAYRAHLSLPIVGITGSVGKTSSKEFISKVLEEKYTVLKTAGNYNNEIGVPLTLLQIRKEHTAAVVEMGISDFGEMSRLSEMVRPDIAVITNIGQCHLENLGTRDGILKAKTEIFESMNPQGYVVLNGDDDKLQTVTKVHGKAPVFFGITEGNLDTCVEVVKSKGLLGSTIKASTKVSGKPEQFSAEVPLPGIHMVRNAACAITVAGLLGLSTEQMQAGLSKLTATSGRGQMKQLGTRLVLDECYNANPASMEAALSLLSMADNTKVAILGDMFELGENSDALHEGVGRCAAKSGADLILLSGENARFMEQGAKKAASASQRIVYFATREQLLGAIKGGDLLPENATVLLKASHGMHYEEILHYLEESSLA